MKTSFCPVAICDVDTCNVSALCVPIKHNRADVFLNRFKVVIDDWALPQGWTVVNGMDICTLTDQAHTLARSTTPAKEA